MFSLPRGLALLCIQAALFASAAAEGEETVASPPSPPPPAPKAMSNHGCECLPTWQYGDTTYTGCDERAPDTKKPWCVLKEEFMGNTRVRCGFAFLKKSMKNTDIEHPRWDFCDEPLAHDTHVGAHRPNDELRAEALTASDTRGFSAAHGAVGVVAFVACTFAVASMRGRLTSRAADQPVDLL